MKEKPYILVVDDDPNIAKLEQLYLEKAGYEVKTVGRGDDAMTEFRKMPPVLEYPDYHGHGKGRDVRQGAGTGAGRG